MTVFIYMRSNSIREFERLVIVDFDYIYNINENNFGSCGNFRDWNLFKSFRKRTLLLIVGVL